MKSIEISCDVSELWSRLLPMLNCEMNCCHICLISVISDGCLYNQGGSRGALVSLSVASMHVCALKINSFSQLQVRVAQGSYI